MKKAPPGYVNPHNETNLLELPRINRLIGQLEGVRKMIEEERHCYEVIHQLRAISSAIQSLEAKILEHHLEHLMEEVFENPKGRLFEIKKKDLLNVLKGKLVISSSGAV